MKRIAVLGGTGMAGHVAVAFLDEKGYDVSYMSKSAPDTGKSKAIDVTDIPALCAWLDSIEPDIIYNCIGVLQKESEARPDIAILLNSYMPRFLEHRYRGTSVKIIHLSTDCVFSGKRGGYSETDLADGEIIYDRTKYLGEITNNKDLTFRMSIIGPDCNKDGSGLFNWFMNQKGTIRGYKKAIWNGVTTIELARAVDAAIQQNLYGLYHLVPNCSIDKYNLLLLIKDVFNRTDIEIEPYNDFVSDKTLRNNRTDFDFNVLPYSEQIKEMKAWIDKHRYFYSYYS